MVAKIMVGRKIKDTFFYNENKVTTGAATCILAGNYPLPLDSLTRQYKLKMLEKMAALNARTTVNSVHISLNFDPSEKLAREQLQQIAKAYMEQIGFGAQPFLVYEHKDSGHPHIHIVTTNIEMDGKAISLHNIGRIKSEPARVQIEKMFRLVRAADHKRLRRPATDIHAAKVSYGRMDSKRAIANVLSAVIDTYRYTSLAELNAVLGLYNIRADRGEKDSRIFKHHGLFYRILDADKQPVGVPIKSSAFFGKPTLHYLESRFDLNQNEARKHKPRVRNSIDFALLKHPGITLKELIGQLEKEGIDIVLRQNSNGVLYGITYVDHRSKCVFNGSTLGKNYTAAAVLKRCDKDGNDHFFTPHQPHHFLELIKGTCSNSRILPTCVPEKDKALLVQLMQPEYITGYLPYELRQNPKRKKKRNRHL